MEIPLLCIVKCALQKMCAHRVWDKLVLIQIQMLVRTMRIHLRNAEEEEMGEKESLNLDYERYCYCYCCCHCHCYNQLQFASILRVSYKLYCLRTSPHLNLYHRSFETFVCLLSPALTPSEVKSALGT